jgi:hypothetical protein
MLPLEVVGPGGSLSTVLIATPYWRDASRRVSWHAATATAVSSCDRTATALVLRLGTAGGGGRGADGFVGDGCQICLLYSAFSYWLFSIFGPFPYICSIFGLFLALVNRPISNSRPVNSAYFYIKYLNVVCRFYLSACSRSYYVLSL